MVIERALEKMRQQSGIAAKAETPARPAADSGRRTESDRRSPARAGATGAHPTLSKPVFPAIAIDPRAAEINRILLPQAQGGDATYAGSAAYRMLRTRLLQRLRSNDWKTLAITSPGAAEGKSLTALNLAINLARDKSVDVFLLDLDMRNPSLCNYLGARPTHELVRYFAGEGAPADSLFSIGIENLTLAGSTIPTEQASELAAGTRLEEMIAYIGGIAPNPVILLDLPPLLVTDEALLVAPRVDATVLVVAEGRTRRDSLARARQLLADFSFAGVILNRSSESYGVDNYYGYGYRYTGSKA